MYKKLIDFLNYNGIPHYTSFNVNKRFMIMSFPRSFGDLRLIAKKAKSLKVDIHTTITGYCYDISYKP